MALTDIEIARANNGQPIREISEKLGLDWQQLVCDAGAPDTGHGNDADTRR